MHPSVQARLRLGALSGTIKTREGSGMHPLFKELFINTQDEVLAEDDERRARAARRRRSRQVLTVRRPAGR
jgi:hypothetical protein